MAGRPLALTNAATRPARLAGIPTAGPVSRTWGYGETAGPPAQRWWCHSSSIMLARARGGRRDPTERGRGGWGVCVQRAWAGSASPGVRLWGSAAGAEGSRGRDHSAVSHNHGHGPLLAIAVAAIPTRFCRQGQKMGKGLVLFSAINSICESALWDISRSVAILGADVDIASTRPLGNMAASAAGNLLAFILLCSRSIRCVHAYHRFYFLLRACTPPLGLSQVLD